MSGKPFPDGKEIVEAVFVLATAAERTQFMEAVKEIGPEKAAEFMMEGLLREFHARRDGQSQTVHVPVTAPTPTERVVSLPDEEPL